MNDNHKSVYLRPGKSVVMRNFPLASVTNIPRQNQSDTFLPAE